MGFRDIPRLHRNNVETLRRSPLAEISGALGDLGTLLPLMIALAYRGSISLSSTLVFSGFFNVATGIVFGIPLPVQPMKAIAAAAIASHTGINEVVAAGSLVSAATLVLSLSGALSWLARQIPVPIVKGVQLGAGLSLVLSAGSIIAGLQWDHPIFDNRLWALLAFILLLLTQKVLPPRFPFALCMFLVGLAVALALLSGGGRLPGFAFWRPGLVWPMWEREEPWSIAVAQLPLTLLNSVVAVSALAAELLPQLPTPSVTELGVSVGVMNLAGCWVGAMPVCHGAGGLAAQYRFGARSGASIILLGLFKMLLGIVFGETLLDLLMHFPMCLIGVMVIAAGLELAMVGQSVNRGASDLWEAAIEGEGRSRDETESTRKHRELSDDEMRERWSAMLITAAGILAFRNDAVGFLAGLLCHWSYRLADWFTQRRARRHDRETESLLH